MDDPWILCVDDEERVLDGIEVTLADVHDVTVASSGAEALDLLDRRAGCGLVISDMRMPNMSGAELLANVRERQPDTSRILLTGHTDLAGAARAVNEGHIFRLLTKPCPPDQLLNAVADGLQQYRLRIGERELLEGTLNGTVQLLVDVLAVAAPAAFERAAVMRQLVAQAAQRLGWGAGWELELAAQLVRLGWIAIPSEVVERYLAGQPLSPDQERLIEEAPGQAARLVARIPRLEPVAALILEAANPGDGTEAAALLRAALDVDLHLVRGRNVAGAIRGLTGRHQPRLLQAMSGFRFERHEVVANLALDELRAGIVVDEDVVTLDDKVLIRADTELTQVLVQRLRNFHATVGIREPVRVRLAREESGSPI